MNVLEFSALVGLSSFAAGLLGSLTGLGGGVVLVPMLTLAFGVDLAHEHGALEPEEGRCGRRGDAVLSCSCLCDEAVLAHALGQQPLADDVVQLV